MSPQDLQGFGQKSWGYKNFPSGSAVKESACNAGDMGLIPGSGRSSGGGPGNPLQDSCWENPMDRGAWWATVQRVAESDMTEATNAGRHKLGSEGPGECGACIRFMASGLCL